MSQVRQLPCSCAHVHSVSERRMTHAVHDDGDDEHLPTTTSTGMNVMCDGQATGKKGHGNTLAWPQLLVKPEQHAGLSQGGRQGLGTAQGNGVGIALGKSDRHLHHHPSPPHYHLSSKGYSQEAPNHWALVWDVGTQAGAAAAAAAAAAARGRLGQWARLRREARGGGILLPQEMEALGRQYSCLEHEFQ
eukprot:158296-Pelagomonas_calceolata.AAC.2